MPGAKQPKKQSKPKPKAATKAIESNSSRPGILEEIERRRSTSEKHYHFHRELAEQFDLIGCLRAFADSIDGEKQLMVSEPETGVFKMAFRWDFEKIGQYGICKEVGFWVASCLGDALPQFRIPGTQYGRGRYPSEMYENWISARPDAIFAIWGKRTRCVLVYKSRNWTEEEMKGRFSGRMVRARETLSKLTDLSANAIRTTLASQLRYPRFIRNPLSNYWYPPPRQSVRTADFANVRIGDFGVTHQQFLAYLDWLDRDLATEHFDHLEAVRSFHWDTGVLSDSEAVDLARGGRIGDGTSNPPGYDAANEAAVGVSDNAATHHTISDEELVRRHEDALAEQEEMITREEEEQRMREEEEEEEAAWILEEDEFWHQEPSHEHCHEEDGQMVTEDDDPCPHID